MVFRISHFKKPPYSIPPEVAIVKVIDDVANLEVFMVPFSLQREDFCNHGGHVAEDLMMDGSSYLFRLWISMLW
jgi:hypothetical protein